jgi:glycerophosphoryl diester phosphodiesterase
MILLDPLARPVVGHRGNRAHAPEDTLPSLLEAVGLGVDAVEFDVHVSRDGHLVVMHDPTLDRTTDERGPVANRTADELRRIDAGYRFTTDGGRTYPWRGRGATVPTFDEVVESLPRELPLIVELKTPAATEAIRTAIRRHALAPRVIVAGFSAQTVRPLRGEGFAIGASTGDVVRALPGALTGRQVTPTCEAFCIPPSHNGIPVPIGAIVKALRASRTVVHVWTVNDRRQALRLWQVGVNGIISDDPAVMLDARRTLGGSLG